MAMVMIFTLLPTTAFADEGGGGGAAVSTLTKTAEDDYVKIEKSASSNGDGTYDITLSVTPLQDLEQTPLEMVILLDLSGSMAWCTRNDGHQHTDACYKLKLICTDTRWYHVHNGNCYELVLTCGYHAHTGDETPSCELVEANQAESRIDIATKAIYDMVEKLQQQGTDLTLSLVKFAADEKTETTEAGYNGAYAVISQKTVSTKQDLQDVEESLKTLDPKGGTYMVPGLEVAKSQFTNNPDSKKVLVMLADGDYNDKDKYDWNDWVDRETRIKNAAQDIKNLGAEIYTIAFTLDIDILKNIATDNDHYSTASNPTALKNILDSIANALAATLIDEMGGNVELDGEVSADHGTATTDEDDTIDWKLTAMTERGATQTITYKVEVDPDTLPVGEDQPVTLNGDVTLSYSVGGKDYKLTVDAPTDTVDVANLTTKVMLDDTEKTTLRKTSNHVLVFDDTTFTLTYPEDEDEITGEDGTVYTYAYSTYNDDVVTDATAAAAVAGENTLVHYYTSGKPDQPTEEELNKLFDGKVEVDCVNRYVSHSAQTFGWDNGNTVGEVYLEDGVYKVDVDLRASVYIPKYTVTGTTHSASPDSQNDVTVTLTYDAENKEWTHPASTGYDARFTVDCGHPGWKVTYDANGGKFGTEDTKQETNLNAGFHWLNTTAEYTPTYTGKVFLGWTANESAKGKTYAKAADLPMMVSSVTITDADKTVYAVWSDDETGTTNPGTGDGVADVYQVTIEYQSADTDKGTVTGLTKEVKTIYNPYPTPSTSGTVRTSGSKAEARDGNKFVNWTADFDRLFEESAADLPAKTITVTGGNTYTFIANFAPKSTPIQPPVTAPYKVEHYLWDETTNAYVPQENDTETIKGTVGEEVTATAKDYKGYAVNPYAEGTKSSGFVTAPKVVDGNLTDLLILKLYYDIDVIGGTDKEDTHYPGDNIPDKYQATVNYVSDDENQGTVSMAEEVITIKDDSGRWAESGKATANGSVAQPGANGVFVKWTQSKNWGNAEDTQLSAATGQIKLTNVNGGDIYTFKAFFEAKNSEIDVEKELYQIVDADGKVKYTGPKSDSNPIPMAVVGDTIVWKITVENKGNQDLSVAFSDELSLEGRSARLYQIGSIYGGKKDITGPLKFAAGMKDEIWAEYTVQSGDEGKTIYNTITAKVGGETGDRDMAPDSVVVEKKALTVDKTVSATSAKVGDTITYTITVKNSGNVTLTGIKLTDELLDIKDADLGNLKPDESLTKNYSYIVKASDVGTLTNTAVVTADDGITGRDTSDPTTVTKDNDDKETGDPHSLHFVTNGGSHISDISKSKPFDANPYDYIPTRPGYVFEGWYSDLRLQNRLDDKDIYVNGHVTVYAKWTASSVPGMLNGDDHFAYIQGYADGTVRPNNYITRAQVATIFFRLLDADVRDDNLTTYNDFSDVAEDYWANTAISTMTKLGVINGYKDGNFRPNAYITRAEFAAICARFDDTVKSGNSSFTDINGHWAKAEIERAATLGWIQGYSDGTFRPNNNITRAQAMTMINRVLCRLPEDEDDLLRGMNTWTDCNPGDWCYLAVQEATNSHDFQHRGVYESWTDLNRDPDWSKYEN